MFNERLTGNLTDFFWNILIKKKKKSVTLFYQISYAFKKIQKKDLSPHSPDYHHKHYKEENYA